MLVSKYSVDEIRAVIGLNNNKHVIKALFYIALTFQPDHFHGDMV